MGVKLANQRFALPFMTEEQKPAAKKKREEALPERLLRRVLESMCEVAPNGKDMHKRVRANPSIVDLDARFRIMDKFGDYAQVICLGAPPLEVFGDGQAH